MMNHRSVSSRDRHASTPSRQLRLLHSLLCHEKGRIGQISEVRAFRPRPPAESLRACRSQLDVPIRRPHQGHGDLTAEADRHVRAGNGAAAAGSLPRRRLHRPRPGSPAAAETDRADSRRGQAPEPPGAGWGRLTFQKVPGSRGRAISVSSTRDGPAGRSVPVDALAPVRRSGRRQSPARRESRPRGRPRPFPRCERPSPDFRPD